MMPALSNTQRFAELVEQRLGLDLESHVMRDLEWLLLERSSAAHLAVDVYVEHLARGEITNEWLFLSDKLTVGETYFFRHLEQLQACCTLIRRLRSKLPAKRPVRVLSAGCSSGEEPYSLAMLLREQGSSGEGIEIVGLDLNARALERARAGRYSDWSLRETSAPLRERWFRRERSGVRLDQTILNAVTFIQGNLAVSGYPLNGEYDFVMCRNVLMYFSPQQFRSAALRLLEALHPDGVLFLGHAESLRGLQINAEAVHELGIFYYLRRPKLELPALEEFKPRLAQLAEQALIPSEVADAPPPVEYSGVKLAGVDALLREERFSEALTLLNTFQQQGEANAEIELRQAMLLVHTNRFEAAEEILGTLLNDDAAASGAHYALAVCHDAASRWQQAAYHSRFSAYLDPTFALPWLHLGLLSKRLGNGHAARQELLHARALLATETPERLLWFGGGCTRATLLETCQRGLDSRGEYR